MPSLDTIVAHLRDAVDHLYHAAQQVRGARETAEELRDLFYELGTLDLVERMQAIADQAGDLLAMLLTGIDAGERLIARTGSVRHGGVPDDKATMPARAPHSSAQLPQSPFPNMPVLAGPDGLSRVLHALPERLNGEGPTTGQLFRPDGQPIPNGTLRSSRDPGILDDLDLTGRARHSESMLSHAEAKAAAMMRRGHAPQQCTIVINNADGPCGWSRRQRGKRATGTSCDELLSDALPGGSRLRVLWRDSDGVERSEVYHGTGRGIRS